MRAIALLLLFFKYVSCLASPSQQPVVISTKSGSHLRHIFSFGAPPLVSNTTTTTTPTPNNKRRTSWAPRRATATWIRSTFLPVGFPASVRPHYISFALWSALQDWSTSLRSVVATQRVLEGVGVGQSTATAVSAVYTFLVRDAAGMAATLLVTSKAARYFGADVKRWRIFADLMVDIGITLEVAAVHVPKEYFLAMLCMGNVCKALCGVAAGATGGAITLYWGKDISDLSAKAGSQRTVVSALGLALSAAFAQITAKARLSVVWGIYAALTVFHIFANVQCLRTLAFEHFNIVRLQKVAETFLNSWTKGNPASKSLSPREVARNERLLFRPWDNKIAFGVSFNEFIHSSYKTPNDVLRERVLDQRYLVSVATGSHRILVVLRKGLSSMEQTKAYFHALLLRRTIQQVKLNRGKAKLTDGDLFLAEQVAQQEVDRAWEQFAENCSQAGWNLEESELQSQGYEVQVQYPQ